MNPNAIIFKLPHFEIKDSCEKDWKKVSEKDFLMKLVENFDSITPILRDMVQGKDFITRNCIYRIQNV